MPKPTMPDQGKPMTAKAEDLTAVCWSRLERSWLKADSKAQIPLAASGVVVGVVLSGAIGGEWGPSDLEMCAAVIWWIGVAGAASGVGGLGFAIFPRLLQSDGSRITYFEDVRRFNDSASPLPH